ncbi:D-aminoacyl-tRNA deacylase 1 isoform X2 [Nymphalis io]|uniref:D-aminoacyl-tRNA deacylase 1 isoform X2 n=1 Tax=Inachis io TaxID=171585 RepID=UPI0021672BF0|nr:D-aminoacyl-tRNA deacylase 1 isoform X2 [Nymphalis io]
MQMLPVNKLINGEVVSSIGQGACILIGICNNDNSKDMEYMARKILSIKLFDDENEKKWKKSIVDNDFEILCVSQFTLYNTWKGNKPDFHNAMPSEKSKEFYDKFIELLRNSYKPEKIKDGVFGAYMQVALQNDGPVTLEIESPMQVEKGIKKTNPLKTTEVEDNADR